MYTFYAKNLKPGFRVWRDPDTGWNVKLWKWFICLQVVRGRR